MALFILVIFVILLKIELKILIINIHIMNFTKTALIFAISGLLLTSCKETASEPTDEATTTAKKTVLKGAIILRL